jgi:redox-regulated HSP33 family molecular chaperone
MIFRRSTILSFVAGLLVSATACHAQNRENALKDMHIGMQGLQQAGEDPAMLAQLMQDMQVRRLGLTSVMSDCVCKRNRLTDTLWFSH